MKKIGSSILLLILISAIFPRVENAAIDCPGQMDNYIGVTQPLMMDRYYQISDVRDFSFDINQPVTYPDTGRERKVPGDGDNVSFSIGINPPNTFFSSIYGNLANITRVFLPTEDYKIENNPQLTPEQIASWKRFYCLSGLDDYTNTGSFKTTVSGTYIYRVEVTSRTINTTSPECIPPVNPPPDWQPPSTCSRTRTRIENRPGDIQRDETAAFTIPFPRSFNELARKVSSVIKEQYCVVGQSTCNGTGYNCIKYQKLNIDPATLKNDPSSVGKDGFCVPKEEQPDGTLKDTIAEVPDQIASLMCSSKIDPSNIPNVEPLKSNVCYFNAQELRVTQTINKCPGGNCSYPLLSSATIGDMTNSIPFDTGIFADNGETTNPDCLVGGDMTKCKKDGYFKRAISNTIDNLPPDEAKWMDNLNGYLDVAGPVGNATQEEGYNPGYYKDVIQDLGKYAEIANNARALSSELIPTGYREVNDKGNKAYLRAVNNVYRGILFINDHPVGKMPVFGSSLPLENPQGPPFIFTQFNQKAFITATVSNSQLFVSLSVNNGVTPGRLMPVPGYDKTYDLGKFFAFITSDGYPLVIAQSGPKGVKNPYKYSVFNGTSWTSPQEFTRSNNSNTPEITGEFASNASFIIDSNDFIHVVGNAFGETRDLGAKFVKYARYKFEAPTQSSGPSFTPIVNPKAVPIPSSLSMYWNSGYTIQSDLFGGAVIAASVNDSTDDFWSDNIWFIHMDLGGNEVTQESGYAVRRDKVNPKGFIENGGGPKVRAHHRFNANGPQIATFLSTFGRQEYYIVYHTHTYMDDALTKVNQINYAFKETDRDWIQDIPLSDRVSDEAGSVESPTIDLNLSTVFSVADIVTKFHKESRLFDPSGYKRCEFSTIFHAAPTTECGKVRDDTFYVIPSSQSSTEMRFEKLKQFY